VLFDLRVLGFQYTTQHNTRKNISWDKGVSRILRKLNNVDEENVYFTPLQATHNGLETAEVELDGTQEKGIDEMKKAVSNVACDFID
jgi:diphthamide synthase (EF-2-diphthine--ammonia ligase)